MKNIEEIKEKIMDLYEQIEMLQEEADQEKNPDRLENTKVKIEILTKKQEKLFEQLKNLQ